MSPSPAERPSRVNGAFVYTGSGKTAQTCPKEAVALQWCLAKRGYREAYCKEELRIWEQCFARSEVREAVNPPAPPGDQPS